MEALLQNIDYLVIGHIAKDITPHGFVLGGTASYASLTARSLGLRVGVVSSAPDDFPLADKLTGAGVQLVLVPSGEATTFENIYDTEGNRTQILSGHAARLTFEHIPQAWQRAPIVHIASLVHEIDPELATRFPTSLLGVTPQGFMRTWDDAGLVRPVVWQDPTDIMGRATAIVFSIEDVGHDEAIVEDYATRAQILVVTRAHDGCSIHWQGQWRHFPAPQVPIEDPTGAGDIFAAAYFHRLQLTNGDPYEAARFAVEIASASINRAGLDSIPTPQDIQAATQTAP